MKIKYFLITAVLATAILGFSGATVVKAADAQSAADCMSPMEGGVNEQIACLQRFISQLMAQIQAIRAQQGGAQTWCHTFNSNLGVGSSGNEVAELHNALSQNAYGTHDQAVYNVFDESFASEVVTFQTKYGILRTGYVGSLTRAKLNVLYGCGVTPPVTAQPSVTSSQSTVQSGQSVKLNLRFPANATHPSLYFICPSGISTSGLPNTCNTYFDVTSNSDYSPVFVNSTSQSLNVQINYTVYLLSGGVDPIVASTNIIVSPVSTSTQPSITSISPNPAIVGSAVTATGVNLCGFESDRNLLIENGNGQAGVIYGSNDSTCNMIKFTLAGSYCTSDTSYSGLPCPSYMTITPGVYNIYARPWGTMSNKVSFTVTSSTQPSITVTSPTAGNVSWQRGTSQTIAWASSSPVDITLSSTSNVFNGSSSLLLVGGLTGPTFPWSAGNWKDGITPIAPDGNYTLWVCPTGKEIMGPLCGSFNLNISTH